MKCTKGGTLYKGEERGGSESTMCWSLHGCLADYPQSLRYKVYHIGPSTPKGKGKDDASGRYRDEPADLERGYDEDEVRRWEAQEQEVSS